MIDLQNLMPTMTSRGDQIVQELEGDCITLHYSRLRGKPRPLKIRRWVDKDLFLIGVTIWACEGTRRRPYELEVSNSSDVIAKLFVQLLEELGLAENIKLRLHAPSIHYERLQEHWKKTLRMGNFTKPIITQGHVRNVENGIIHIKVYSALARELFRYWAERLPQLL